MRKTVLFTKQNSIYEQLGCDCYGLERDARTYNGKEPVIAHPPCRAWGKFKTMAKPRPGEKDLALYALAHINKYGGILEHPKSSDLWKLKLTLKGFILPIQQYDFGHRARKDTNLYIVGIKPTQLPAPPIYLGKPHHKVELMGKSEREATPPLLARYLVDVLEVIQNETIQNKT